MDGFWEKKSSYKNSMTKKAKFFFGLVDEEKLSAEVCLELSEKRWRLDPVESWMSCLITPWKMVNGWGNSLISLDNTDE